MAQRYDCFRVKRLECRLPLYRLYCIIPRAEMRLRSGRGAKQKTGKMMRQTESLRAPPAAKDHTLQSLPDVSPATRQMCFAIAAALAVLGAGLLLVSLRARRHSTRSLFVEIAERNEHYAG